MALVQSKVFCNVTLQDYDGDKATIRYDLNKTDLADLATDIAEITGAGGLLADLAGVTNAVIVGYSVGVSFAEDGSQYPAQGVNIEEIAEISAAIASEVDKWATIRVPAPKAGDFLDGPGENADIIDVADAAVIAYLANFEADGLLFTSDGESIKDTATAGNFKGKRIFRASRK